MKRIFIAGKGEPEGTIHPFLLKTLQHLPEIVYLHLLGTFDLLAQARWVRIAVHDGPSHRAAILCPAIGTAAKLGDHYRPLVEKVGTQLLAVATPVASILIVINSHNIKETPVNVFPGSRGIGDWT